MKFVRSFDVLLLLLLLSLLVPSQVAAFAAKNHKIQKLDHRNHDVAKNPDVVVKHSTERLEEPGKKRNYGTEYTKPKQRHHEDVVDLRHRDSQGRAWSYGTYPFLHQKSSKRDATGY